MIELAQKIAPYLPGWRFNRIKTDQSNNWRKPAYFTNGCRAFYLGPDWRDESRCKVQGEHSSHSIGFDPNRDPEALARDIQRRFIPQFVADCIEYEKHQASREQAEKDRQIRESLIKQIWPDLREYQRDRYHSPASGVTVNFDYKPELTIRCSFDDLIKLGYFIKENLCATDT